MVYEIEFPDRQIKKYTSNILAENILSQIDSEGFSTVLFDSIISFRKNKTVVEKTDRFITITSGCKKLKQTITE